MDDVEITRNAFLAGRGDRVAAGNFVSATQRQLYRLLSYLSNADVAEDLVQETYLRAFAALPRFAGRAPARMWLLAIAKHVAAGRRQARPRTGSLPPSIRARACRTTAGSSCYAGWSPNSTTSAAKPSS